MAKSNRVYISGYWDVKTNIKKSRQQYFSGLEKIFRRLEREKIYFFTDDKEMIKYVKKSASECNASLTIIERSLSSLQAFRYSEMLLDCAERMFVSLEHPNIAKSKEKGVIHKHRDIHQASGENYKKLITIWLSKIFLVNEVIAVERELNIADDLLYCWIDCTIERVSYTRSNWDFTKLELPLEQVSHYTGQLHYMGLKMTFSAGFLSAGQDIWKKMLQMFEQELQDLDNTNYAHDEETVFMNIKNKNPQLFNLIGDNYVNIYSDFMNEKLVSLSKTFAYYARTLEQKI